MKTRFLFNAGIVVLLLSISACGDHDKELQNDTKNIADVMCRSLDVMHQLRVVNPSDSIRIKKLQATEGNIQNEMTALYKEFNTKYGDKAKNPEFVQKFRKYLGGAMLKCKNLSKEDREAFEKDAR